MNQSGSNTLSIEQAYEECRRVTRERARNFYYGLKLAPEPKRSALFALYAWMRAADDLVDAADDNRSAISARDALSEFLAATRIVLARENPFTLSDLPAIGDAAMWTALHDVGRTYPLAPAYFDDMIEGQLADLEQFSYPRFADLREYCYRVASTVGLLCISIWGYNDPRAETMAIERGIAFQLTNIIRDFAEDFDRGRVYLPADDFAQVGLTPAELRTWSKPATCRAFVIEQVRRAKSCYEKSRHLDVLITPDCRPVLWAMTTIYESLLDRIAQSPERVVHSAPVRLSKIHKGMIALEARRRARHARRRRDRRTEPPTIEIETASPYGLTRAMLNGTASSRAAPSRDEEGSDR